jgi:hypothetical protein
MLAQDNTPVSPGPYKRRLWQIHLSTAVVVMLVAGAFIFVNCRPTLSIAVRSVRHLTFVSGKHETRYGWPSALLISQRAFSAETRHLPKDESSPATWQDRVFSAIDRHDIETGSPECSVQTAGLAIDAAVLFVTIVLAAFVCEYMIRRSKP